MDQDELLKFVVDVLTGMGVDYGITGSHASMTFGEARFTNDIDIVVALDRDRVERFCSAFSATDFYVSIEAARQAVTRGGMFNIILQDFGLKVDIIVPPTEEARSELGRTVEAKIAGSQLARFISPEDLIIHKMKFYQEGGSEKHVRDIVGMIQVLGERLDREAIESRADVELLEIWKMILSRIPADS